MQKLLPEVSTYIQYNTIQYKTIQYNTIQYSGLYFKRVAHDSKETDNPVALYKIKALDINQLNVYLQLEML